MFLIYKHHAWLDIPHNLLWLLSALPRLTQCLLNSAISYRIFTAVLLSEVTILFSPAQHHSWLTALSQRESKTEPFSHLILKCKVFKNYRKLFLYSFCAPVPLPPTQLPDDLRLWQTRGDKSCCRDVRGSHLLPGPVRLSGQEDAEGCRCLDFGHWAQPDM